MHHHISCKGHGEVVAQSFLAEPCGELQGIPFHEVLIRDFVEIVAAVEYLKQQFVAFLAILAHQGLQCLHGRCLYLLEAIESIHLAYDVEDIVTLCHLHWGEVACSFWNAWFLGHYLFLIVIFLLWSVHDPDR